MKLSSQKWRHSSSPAQSNGHNRNMALGIISGLAGGLVGTIAMTQFQNAWTKASKKLKAHSEQSSESGQQSQESEDATMKAAGKIAGIGGRQLSHEQKKKLGPVVHYSFGTIQGGVYGAVTESLGKRGGVIAGLLFGAALFAVADEFAVPALGLSGSPTEYPVSSHLYALASHLVYGVTADAVTRAIRAAV